MLPAYNDIRLLIDKEPLWFDHHGVPRYSQFEPAMLGIYDNIAICAEIRCRACKKHFYVGEGFAKHKLSLNLQGDTIAQVFQPIALAQVVSNYSYGDPPRHNCKMAGEVMTSDLVAILQCWERGPGPKWVRYPEYETSPTYSEEDVI